MQAQPINIQAKATIADIAERYLGSAWNIPGTALIAKLAAGAI